MSTHDRRSWVVTVAMVGVAAGLFLLLVYGYPRLFPLVEGAHPDHFEANVAEAMGGGDVDKAQKIARRAVQVRPFDPMAYTVYGRVLLASGKPDEALVQLLSAVNLVREPEPESRETRAPFYFAPARLTLGKYYLEQGRLADAVENFELARAYAVPADVEYKEFHAVLYRAYAQFGFWARALEFGEPSEKELDRLDGRELARIAAVCEGRQNWKLAEALAQRLLTHEGYAGEAHYLLGRAAFARQHYAASTAHLEQAVADGLPHAAFFLGTALKSSGEPARAVEAFLRTASDDVYHPFALAGALSLFADFPEIEQTLSAGTGQELLDQLDHDIADLRLLPRPLLYDKYGRFAPVSVVASEPNTAVGAPFPVLVLWEDRQAPVADPRPVFFSSTNAGDSILVLRRANNILQLQWVGNRVNWGSVECLPAGAGAVPGWIDTARDWFGLRPDYAAQVQKDDTGNAFLSMAKRTWFYSIPIPVRDRGGYLLAGRTKSQQDTGCLGWQALDSEGRVVSEDSICRQETSDTWTWQAGYFRSQLLWSSLRVQLDVMRHAGTVAFDDVMLLELNEPDPAAWSG